MKTTISLLIILCFSMPVMARGTHTTIQLIIDDSGVLIVPADADKYKLLLLSHLKGLTRKREFARAHIDVISTSIGRTIWSGVPSDLKRKPERALELVNAIKSNPENCNNLPGAFMELASNINALERQGFTNTHVIVFSSLIHTPRPCSEATTITLPQPPPLEGDINQTLSAYASIHSISFYWASPHQKHVWEEFLEPSFNSAKQRSIPMNLMDIERSKFSLRNGLNLEVSK